ncbi:uncharacterized protein CANTADRAFT_147903 [Suhomyces tanzawaensis NRRL Y-17324]|uniref:Uncharacterized protein n=1 Tax=Suhomyces tanzawaensis NRRL Y-17324 TaxID=984487 RepID=A0A1E4SAU7_9ASCO|nr:uncharacterized protein CANTADRAFT_147903 [Suhomyces tanzawaensis NRRL Y-17324]ODV76621.1 hypothetical protein CANTADRAFT_147903 [Suhomyces tanzawaensis NRRL Y-17324]
MTNTSPDDTVFEDAVNHSFAYGPTAMHVPSSAFSHLQKLPDASSVRFHQHQHQQHHQPPPTNDVSVQTAARTAVTDAELLQFRLHREKLALAASRLAVDAQRPSPASNSANTSKPPPIYYRPPSSNIKGTQFGIQSFLPPGVDISSAKKHTTNHVPLYINNKRPQAPPTVKSTIEALQHQQRPDLQEDDVDEHSEGPSGDWTNPIMIQALARQIDRESYTRRLLQNVLYLLGFQFVRTLVTKVWELYQTRKKSQLQIQYNLHHPLAGSQELLAPDATLVVAVVCWAVVVIFGVNIVGSAVMLLKGQDQCYDLPLSDSQRRLIGLKARYDREDDASDQLAELELKQRRYATTEPVPALPKYTKLNQYEHYNFGTSTSVTEPEIQLSLAEPQNRRFLGGPVAKRVEVSAEEREQFTKNFSVRF